MKNLKGLCELIDKEIGEVVKRGEIYPDEWDHLGEAVDILKDITTIEAMNDYGDSGKDWYSRDQFVKEPIHIKPHDSLSRDDSSETNF